jgi:hypothetical protein
MELVVHDSTARSKVGAPLLDTLGGCVPGTWPDALISLLEERCCDSSAPQRVFVPGRDRLAGSGHRLAYERPLRLPCQANVEKLGEWPLTLRPCGIFGLLSM